MGKLDPDDVRPPYRQVASSIQRDIKAQRLRPGDKLPSIAALAEDFGVSHGTVKRAIGLLQTGGLVVSRQGQGAFVRTVQPDDADGEHDVELAELRARVDDLNDRLEEVERHLKGQ